jgi:hypothetical protein
MYERDHHDAEPNQKLHNKLDGICHDPSKGVTRNPARVMAAALAAAVLYGCGKSSDAAVTGTVTLQGKPLAGVTITLVPDAGGDKFVGSSDAQGNFSIPTGGKAVSGGFKVVVIDPVTARVGGKTRADDPYIADQNMPKNPAIPSKFAAEQTTTARVSIEPGKPVAIDLTP